ncbi:ribosome-recycling factor, mitochondrial [Nilaparvata lugens]|uniref:ribosome-recycling factor, mitochondrial n=1 Tax=Nilaparvata lugens TaxID=108931 RepID=UPI000B998E4C|nr:ribosome-recycling factor, mitochondrial [Nilaparvata lugens]
MSLSHARVFMQLISSSFAAISPRLRYCSKCIQNRFIHNSLPLITRVLTNNTIQEKNSSHLLSVHSPVGVVHRSYAKGRDKKKGDKGQKKSVSIDESVLNGVVDVENLRSQMQKHVDDLQEDYIKNLSLRSTSGAIEQLKVKFEGNDYVLQDLAQVIRQNPKSIILNMASFPTAIPAVLDAIAKSGMNLNCQQDATKLFIPVPKVTKELREQLAKNAKALFIKCKDNIKDVQNKHLKTVKSKEKTGLSQDLSRTVCDQITAVCDTYVAQAEKVLSIKEAELKGNQN